MYRIGQFSKLGKTTVKTLRYYDRISLLKPEKVDPFTGYRMYSSGQLLTLHVIQSMRQAGLSVAETKKAISGDDYTLMLEKRKNLLEIDLEKTRQMISKISFILSSPKQKTPTSK